MVWNQNVAGNSQMGHQTLTKLPTLKSGKMTVRNKRDRSS